MKIRLGYACISNIIELSSSKTVTLTNYRKYKNIEKIDNIIKENLINLERLIIYNINNNFHFFRITSNLIPLIDIVNIDLNKYNNYFIKIGNLIRLNNMRVDVHADQYCVLNSINSDVVLNSIKILNNIKRIMDMFNIKYNIILHIGSKTGGINNSIKRFISSFNLLDDDIKELVILENDDKSFNVYQTLKLCEKLCIPMCLDIHHHYCNKCSKDIRFYLERIYNTFNNTIPKMHFSSPKSKKEYRSHSDYIDSDGFVKFINLLLIYDKNTDIMLEAKNKDLALIKLVYELKNKENILFIDESSFTFKCKIV